MIYNELRFFFKLIKGMWQISHSISYNPIFWERFCAFLIFNFFFLAYPRFMISDLILFLFWSSTFNKKSTNMQTVTFTNVILSANAFVDKNDEDYKILCDYFKKFSYLLMYRRLKILR
jgi:hypothetical protein